MKSQNTKLSSVPHPVNYNPEKKCVPLPPAQEKQKGQTTPPYNNFGKTSKWQFQIPPKKPKAKKKIYKN